MDVVDGSSARAPARRPREELARPRRESGRHVDHGRHVGDRQVAGPRGDDPVTLQPDDGPDTAERVVAVAARELLEGHTLPRRPAPGRTPPARSRRGAGSTPWGRRRGPRPRSCGVPAVDATVTEPPSRASTIGISAAASACTSEPTVVPRLRIVGMGDLRQRERDQRLRASYVGRGEHVGVTRERPDAYAVRGGLDPGQVGQAVDVDQGGRCGEPHVEQRHQALPAGQDLRTRIGREGLQRVLEALRSDVGERCRLQVTPGRARPGVPASARRRGTTGRGSCNRRRCRRGR